MKPARLELRIDELVLHGFPPGDRHRIGAALETELTRLFTEQGVPAAFARGGSARALDAGQFEAAPGAGAEAVGREVARTIYRGFGE